MDAIRDILHGLWMPVIALVTISLGGAWVSPEIATAELGRGLLQVGMILMAAYPAFMIVLGSAHISNDYALAALFSLGTVGYTWMWYNTAQAAPSELINTGEVAWLQLTLAVGLFVLFALTLPESREWLENKLPVRLPEVKG